MVIERTMPPTKVAKLPLGADESAEKLIFGMKKKRSTIVKMPVSQAMAFSILMMS